ncbi:hypothetical protein JHK82_044265 [Glycine max]|uniref:Uncharacterized protein n=1 Tax=Glycine max TaxID=3847 RepID=A0A0R0FWT6_SOYBN|nr:hypothetical protein JHK85_045223 [Glycine max]KAG5099213.1 hypothetical protein JHK82_044265 [Glycine max]KRH07163.1 hypothetical protein GLYMA_16G071300v4 [Glycine max]
MVRPFFNELQMPLSSSSSSSAAAANSAVSGEIMLFGVRVVVDSMRKSVSMNNLSQYKLPRDAAGYASAADAAPIDSGKNRDRKRGPTNVFYNSLSLPRFVIILSK